MPKTRPPDPSELELSVFGPGKGECLVVHFGAGEWMVVDSCLNEQQTKPIAIEYLESLGVDVSKQVRLVLVTHWHDDHIRGVAALLHKASAARFACSAALRKPIFFGMLAANNRIKVVGGNSGVSEFANILSVKTTGPDHWVNEGMLLYSSESRHQVRVHALSPSARTVTDAIVGFARTIPTISKGIQPFPNVTPNDESIVLLVETKHIHLLLGGDLQRGANSQRGWQAVVASTVRPRLRSCGYKVAHHEADNGDIDAIWTDLNEKNPHVLLTPFAGGPKPRPADDDITRLRTRTNQIYCTVWPIKQTPIGRVVDRTMNEVARQRRAIPHRAGHIRLRAPLAGKVQQIVVDLFSNARRI